MKTNKAYLIEENGDTHEVTPIDPKSGFSLKELYSMLQCTIVQIVELHNGNIMICDEESKLCDEPVINNKATELYQEGRMSISEYKKKMQEQYGDSLIMIESDDEELDNSICGHVLVCPPEMFE